ncbi:MAG: branched-chain amino acid ABC transporter permease [Beijerinckiaceae bacterium]
MIGQVVAGMSTRARVLLAALAIAMLAAPLVLDRYLLSVLILVCLAAYTGQAWNILMGFAGLLSLGHALYLGLGAYVSTALYVHFGIGPWLGIFPAIAVCVLAAAAIGWLSFRFRIEGVYFALLTIAFAEVARIGFDHVSATGGAGGFFLPVGAEDQGQWWNLRGGPVFFYYLAFLLAVAAFVLCATLRRSRIGHRWLAVREDPEAARALGIDINRARMSALLLSAAMTGTAGVFQAFYSNNLFPSQIFDISRSIDIILAPIVGGIGTLFGPVLGAFVLAPLGEFLIAATQALGLNAPGMKALFFGLFLMVIIAAVPSGLWPRLAGALGLRSAPR